MQELGVAIAPMNTNLLNIWIGDQVSHHFFGCSPNAHMNGVTLLAAACIVALPGARRSAVHHLKHHTVLISTGSAPTRLIPLITPMAVLASVRLPAVVASAPPLQPVRPVPAA